ncbi:MAG: glyoxalase [Clostridium sp. SCN 57-10]|nr:MAG: glyoxalase [Clostridium sp. SCN 57-10]
MGNELNIKMYGMTLDCKDPYELAKFYAALLRWEISYQDEEYVCVGAPGAKQGAYPGITFQKNEDYVPPVWPEQPGAQQQMAHIDFAVSDVEQAVRYAVECGATVAGEQFSDGWTVMFDPAGHPFCLCRMAALFESADFALR